MVYRCRTCGRVISPRRYFFLSYYCKDCDPVYEKIKTTYPTKSKTTKQIKFYNGRNISKTSEEARLLFQELIKRNVPAELEKWDGHKHIDIAIPSHKINIEVDGKQHHSNRRQALSDILRTYYSFTKGYFTLRIPNTLVRDEESLLETANMIIDFLEAKDKQEKLI